MTEMNERLTNECTQAGRTIDTNNRREQMKRKQGADVGSGGNQARSSALKPSKADEEAAGEEGCGIRRNSADMSVPRLEQDGRGYSEFAKSAKGVSMKDPMAEAFNPLGSLLGRRSERERVFADVFENAG